MFKQFIYILAAASFIFGGIAARAQDAGALLDLLVRKKIITDQEAEEVRADLTKEAAATSAGKWKLSTPITELELYGDTRLRYEYRSGQTTGKSANANAIVCALGSAAFWRTTGSLVFGWKRVKIHVPLT